MQTSVTKKTNTARHTSLKKEAYVEGVGRRKTAVARARIIPGNLNKDGEPSVMVNEKPFKKYFPIALHQNTVVAPLLKTDTHKQISATIKVAGGGLAAQAGAARLGLARALVSYEEKLRKQLKQYGFLTRDARMVERKKYGLKKARRAPQWSKR